MCLFGSWRVERPRSARWSGWDGERFRPFRLVTACRLAEQVRERLQKQLRRRAKEMGFEVRKIAAPPATEPGPQG